MPPERHRPWLSIALAVVALVAVAVACWSILTKSVIYVHNPVTLHQTYECPKTPPRSQHIELRLLSPLPRGGP